MNVLFKNNFAKANAQAGYTATLKFRVNIRNLRTRKLCAATHQHHQNQYNGLLKKGRHFA